ncbi:MAG: VOC family protein [Erythrobacter sp.]|uniref:VOC family protein n=1 Tax=Erythrobacter sp. TaxID=1042 RepID=UPI0025E96AD4|nr:VOC family protein [Erythrobacter sp.]MCL9999485.1 VOC family protein [Erythrobacter sp.]
MGGVQVRHGQVTWHELMTDDPAAAQAFYAAVFGWRFDPGAVGGRSYDVIIAGDVPVGGMLGLDPAMQQRGARPVWAAYAAVDDLEEAGRSVRAGGGQVLMAGLAIPGMGALALAADPEGAPFYVMGYENGPPSAPSPFPPLPGHCAWNELAAQDPDRALAFYGELLGWRQEGEMPMGEHGSYRFVHHDDRMIGAVMPTGDTGMAPGWTFYFVVADIDAGAAEVRAGGGTVLHDPVEIPGGDFSVSALDPQGATFGLVGPRRT